MTDKASMQRKQSFADKLRPSFGSSSAVHKEMPKDPQAKAYELVRQFDDLWNNQNFGVIDNNFTKDVMYHSPVVNVIGMCQFDFKICIVFLAFSEQFLIYYNG